MPCNNAVNLLTNLRDTANFVSEIGPYLQYVRWGELHGGDGEIVVTFLASCQSIYSFALIHVLNHYFFHCKYIYLNYSISILPYHYHTSFIIKVWPISQHLSLSIYCSGNTPHFSFTIPKTPTPLRHMFLSSLPLINFTVFMVRQSEVINEINPPKISASVNALETKVIHWSLDGKAFGTRCNPSPTPNSF